MTMQQNNAEPFGNTGRCTSPLESTSSVHKHVTGYSGNQLSINIMMLVSCTMPSYAVLNDINLLRGAIRCCIETVEQFEKF